MRFYRRRLGLEGYYYYYEPAGRHSRSRSVGRVIAKFAANGKVQAKKNLGLMQMQCKDVYVAYVSMGTNQAKLLQNAPLRIKGQNAKAAEEVVYKMTYTMVLWLTK